MEKEEELMFGGEPDGDIIYAQNEFDPKLDSDFCVCISKFLGERHRQKFQLMTQKLEQKRRARPKNEQIEKGENINCECVNFDLSAEENFQIIQGAENAAFESVKDETEKLALCGHEKAIAFYLQHVHPEQQNQRIRQAAKKIAEKQIKTAEEWEISASLKFFDEEDEFFSDFNDLNLKNLSDWKLISWAFTYYYAREKRYEKYEKFMEQFQKFSSQIRQSPAYVDFVKAQTALFGRNVNSSFESVSNLDDCLAFLNETNADFFDRKTISSIFGNLQEQTESSRGKKTKTTKISAQHLADSLAKALNLTSNCGEGEATIKIKDVPAFVLKKMKDLVSCDEVQMKESLAHGRFLAFCQPDEAQDEKGFAELSMIGANFYKSEEMKSFNKPPKFLQEFQGLFEPEKENKQIAEKGNLIN